MLGHLGQGVEVWHYPREDFGGIGVGEEVVEGEKGKGEDDEEEVPEDKWGYELLVYRLELKIAGDENSETEDIAWD